MTFTEVVFLSVVVCAISLSWLVGYVRLHPKHDHVNEVRGLDDLDELRWHGWTPVTGWPSVTCWHGCLRLHRDDWWTAYVYRTCWPGCANLHRDDWWRAYVDQAERLRG